MPALSPALPPGSDTAAAAAEAGASLSDRTLLNSWRTAGRSEDFTELVRRHFHLVRGIARRQLGEDLAEDTAQNVFTILARKAPDARCLSAWLHRVTVLQCRDAVRRKLREQRARRAAMEMSTLSEARDPLEDALPHLDAAIASLDDRDRELLLLRYSEGLSFTAAATRVGRTETALRKQTERALEKLSLLLKRRGVSVPALTLASGLGGVLGSPPAAQAVTVTVAAAAMAGAGTAGLAGVSLLSLTLATMTTAQSLAAGAVTAALFSAIPLGWQSYQLHHQRSRTASEAAASASAAPASAAASPADTPPPQDAGKTPSGPPSGGGSAAAAVSPPSEDAMEELSTALEAEAEKVMRDWARSTAWTESRRLAMVLGLSPERENALRAALTEFQEAKSGDDMAEGSQEDGKGKSRRQYNARRGAWLNGHLSPTELTMLQSHEQAQREALTAAKSEEALHQISSKVELTDDQKTRLFNAGAAKVAQDLDRDEYGGSAQFMGTFQSATPPPVEEAQAGLVARVLDPAQQQLWRENADRSRYTTEDMPRRLVDRAVEIIRQRGLLNRMAAMMSQMLPPDLPQPPPDSDQ